MDKSCPAGFIVKDNICKRNLDEACPEGFYLVENICKRIKNDSCPSGFFLHDGTCYRQAQKDHDCPIQYKLEDGKCVPKSDSILKRCAEEEILLNNKCYKTVKTCPSGYNWSNGVCTRFSGISNYIYNNVYTHPQSSTYVPGSINNVNNVNVFPGSGCGYRNCKRN